MIIGHIARAADIFRGFFEENTLILAWKGVMAKKKCCLPGFLHTRIDPAGCAQKNFDLIGSVNDKSSAGNGINNL